jgi:hypothetical protein
MNTHFYIQNMLTPLVSWALSNGVDYKEMARLLKPLFLEASKQLIEEAQIKQKAPPVAELAAVSGLSGADVKDLLQNVEKKEGVIDEYPVQRISNVSQIVAAWLAKGLPQKLPARLPTQGDHELPASFAELVRQTAKQAKWAGSYSLRLIMQNMEKRGLILIEDNHVVLRQAVGMNVIDEDVLSHFAGSVGDHIRSCAQNLTSSVFLEQSINVNELTPSAAWELQNQVSQWWLGGSQYLVAKASEIDAACADRPSEQKTHRFRVGIYVYTDADQPSADAPSVGSDADTSELANPRSNGASTQHKA